MDKGKKGALQPAVEVRARGKLVRIPDHLATFSTADIQRLVYDLAVHQLELEAQNEQLRRAEELIELGQARYRDLFMNAPVGYLTLDNQNRVMDINSAALDLLGVSRPIPPDQQIVNFISPTDLWRFHKHVIQAMASNNVETCELQLRKMNGETVHVQASISAIPLRSTSTGEQVRMSLLDITRRKQQEEQTQQLNDALNRMAAELTAANREVDAISHLISRELQAPLTLLMQADEKLQTASGQNASKLDLVRIREASNQISLLLNELLHLTRAGHSPFMHIPVDMTRLALNTVAELQQSDPDRKVTVTVADDMNCQGDRRLMEMVMAKLIGNAWKYTNKKKDARIEIGITRGGNRDIFFVRDNGIGFDMKYADKLFKPFQRLPSAEEFPGRGFGLAMVSRIIRRHGGTIWAEAAPDKGATFFFTVGPART